MALTKLQKDVCITMIDCALIFLITVFHFISFFLIKSSDFTEIFDTYDSSPLFDLTPSDTPCSSTYNIIFHKWEGVKEVHYHRKTRYTRQKDATNIEKLKDKYFCYKPMTYKELLYNGQIKKEGETLTGEYKNDCGVIDTLGQHLYIKDSEDCPFNEVKIDGDNIIRNNDKDIGKKIIGKLILNDGQPCYKSNEKLWKKFHEGEWADEHLECDVEIFGKKTDSRYINRGSVTYDEIYKQNLDPLYYEKLKNKVGDNKVTLYSREFLGIDKKCDEESSITREKIDKLNDNQGRIKFLYLFEAIFNLCLSLCVFTVFMIWVCCIKKNKYLETVANSILIGELLVILGCLIAEAVYLSRIIKNDTSYQCSDDITNELFKKENDNTEKSILYLWINLGLDIFVIVGNAIVITIGILTDKKKDDDSKSSKSTDKASDNNFFNSANKDFKSDCALDEKVREVVVDNNNYNNNNYNNNNYNSNNNYNNNNNYNANYNNNYNSNNNYNTNYNNYYNSNNNYNTNYNNYYNNNNNYNNNNYDSNYNNNNNNNYNNYNINNNFYNNANNNVNNNYDTNYNPNNNYNNN